MPIQLLQRSPTWLIDLSPQCDYLLWRSSEVCGHGERGLWKHHWRVHAASLDISDGVIARSYRWMPKKVEGETSSDIWRILSLKSWWYWLNLTQLFFWVSFKMQKAFPPLVNHVWSGFWSCFCWLDGSGYDCAFSIMFQTSLRLASGERSHRKLQYLKDLEANHR